MDTLSESYSRQTKLHTGLHRCAETCKNLRKYDFWTSLEESYEVQIPTYVKNLLQTMGYDNPISFQRITWKTFEEIEGFVRQSTYNPLSDDSIKEDYYGVFFAFEKDKFMFTPGDKDLILGLVERVKKYSDVFRKLLNY